MEQIQDIAQKEGYPPKEVVDAVKSTKKSTRSIQGKNPDEIYDLFKKTATSVAGEDINGENTVDVQYPQLSASTDKEINNARKAASRFFKKSVSDAQEQGLITGEQADKAQIKPPILNFQPRESDLLSRKYQKPEKPAFSGFENQQYADVHVIRSEKAKKAIAAIAVGSTVFTPACSLISGIVTPNHPQPPKPTAILPNPDVKTTPATPTTEPTFLPEIPTAQPESPFASPVNPPEFTPSGTGGEFPSEFSQIADTQSTRALYVLAKQEGESISGKNEEEFTNNVYAWAGKTHTITEQSWNEKTADEFQLVTVDKRTDTANQTQTIYWFATEGGAFSARPDIPSTENSKLVEITSRPGFHFEFRWGEDGNIYMFEVDNATGQASRWFNTTVANASDQESIQSGFAEISEASKYKEVINPIVNSMATEIYGDDVTPEQISGAMNVVETEKGVELQMNQRRYHYGPDYDYWIDIDSRAVAIANSELSVKVSGGQIIDIATNEAVTLPEDAGNIQWLKDYAGSDEIPAGIYAVTRDGFVTTVYKDGSWQKVEQDLIAFPEMQLIQPETVVALLPELVMAGKAELDPNVQHEAWLYWLDNSIANAPANADYMRSLGITASNPQKRVDQLVSYLQNNNYNFPSGLRLISGPNFYFKFRLINHELNCKYITINILPAELHFTEYLNKNLEGFIGVTNSTHAQKYKIRERNGYTELLYSESTDTQNWLEKYPERSKNYSSIGNLTGLTQVNINELNKVIEFFPYAAFVGDSYYMGLYSMWEKEGWDEKSPQIQLIKIR